MNEGISEILPVSPSRPPLPMAAAFWDSRLLVTASFTPTSL
jgi:hypothetical protein